MNRSYRHVWSAARGAFVIAAENARGRGKSGRAVKAAAPAMAAIAAAAACLALAGPALAQTKAPTSVVPTGGKTNAYVAPNGVPVVNIDAANAAGISHNTFTTYNVDANGLVLNNTPFATATLGQSQLAGGILGNTNMKAPANVILNEVVSTNRSTLSGYTEVYGSRADVIVVNPNGLTCNGCGFINTDRVTLSTGAPTWAADGSLIGFNVSRGDIAIGGNGLNASAQQILDLVTRSVRVDGQVNVGKGELGVFTGPIQWNYQGRNVAGTVAVNDTKPLYAIDSTSLGGMYAGRIRLIATEAGVGVRMLGDAAAAADDFRIDAAGKVLLQGHVSAARDVTIVQTGSAGAGQIEVSGANASLSAQRDLALNAAGGVLLDEAGLKAVGNLTLQADALADTSATNAARSANGGIDLTLAKGAAIAGSAWGAGTHLTIDADSLNIIGATLYSGAAGSGNDRALTLGAAQDVTIDTTKITSADKLSARARGGALRLGAGAQLTSASDTALTALTTVDNAGNVLSGAGLTVDGGTASVPLQLANGGLLQAQGTLALGAGGAVAIGNTAAGRLLADRIALNATTVDNAGTVQATNGLEVTASGAVANRKGGALLDTGAGKDLTVTAASLDNAGALQSAGAIAVATTGATANGGQMLTTAAKDGGADGALTLKTAALANTGTLAAASALAIDADSVANAGMMLATGDATLKAAQSIENTKLIQAANVTLNAGALLHSGGADASLEARGDLNAQAHDIANDAAVLAARNLSMTAAGAFANGGALQTTDAQGAVAISGATFSNKGTIGAAGAATLSARTGVFDNGNNIVAGGDLRASAGGILYNQGAAGLLQSGRDLTVSAGGVFNQSAMLAQGNVDVTALDGIANVGTMLASGASSRVALNARSVSNLGTLKSAGAMTVSATDGNIANQGQAIAAGALALYSSQDVANAGGALVTATNLTVRSASLNNDGTVQASSSIGTLTSGAINNRATLQTTGDNAGIVLNAASITNAGDLASKGSGSSMVLNAGSITNAGTLAASGANDSIALNTGNGAIANAGTLASSGINSTITLNGGGIANAGTLAAIGTDSSVVVNAASVANTGKLASSKTLSLTATQAIANNAGGLMNGVNVTLRGASLSNGGILQASTSMDAATTGTINNNATLQVTGVGGTAVLSAAGIANAGTLASAGALTLTSSGAIANSGQLQAQDALALVAQGGVGNTNTIIGANGVSIGGGAGNGVSNAAGARIQAGTTLNFGAAAAPLAYLTNNGTLQGGTAGLYAANLTNTGRIQSAGAATVSGGTVVNSGSSAVILLGMDGSASTLSGSASLRNEGAIHTAGDLSVAAPRLDNTNTGGISSEAKLTMNAGAAGFDNAGALYAGTLLTVNANGQTFNNVPTGTMDANDIVVNAGTFNNYNTVIAQATTTINTTNAFSNLPTGTLPTIVSNYDYRPVTQPYYWSGNCNIFGAACDSKTTFAQDIIVTQTLDRPMPTQFGQVIAGNTITIRYGNAGLNQASLISAPTVNISGTGTFTNADFHLEEIDYARRWRDYRTNSTFGPIGHTYNYATDAGQLGGCNDGDCFAGTADSLGAAQDAAFRMETGRQVIQKWRAGVYATNLTFNGGSLMNLGSPYAQATTSQTVGAANGASAATLNSASTGSVSTATAAGAVAGAVFTAQNNKTSVDGKTVSVASTPTLQFQGLNLALPTNPNGYFVTAKNPNSGYLVETNPLFGASNNSVGSDYLTKLLNINPDQQIKRLGDANYEAKLVRDQLVAQTGNNILAGLGSEADQMKSLMNNASQEASALGLTYGQPLNADQLANLKEDMVWMVETVVAGQKVVAPVVYLAKSTKDAIEGGGAVLAAKNMTINAGTVSNTGGTIAGGKVDITTKGDITNTGGTIKGADLALKSTEGSIVNQTVAETHGGGDFARTTIGATGSIQSTGSLSMDAAKDITVKGADVKAGGAATLAAGGNVTFDTIQDKRADSVSRSTEGGLFGMDKEGSSLKTSSTTNIGSTLSSGGNLSISSGGKTTIAGSQVKTGGDLSMDAKGGVDIVSRQDTKQTTSSTTSSGLGVGGGLFGSTSTTTDSFKGTNVASGIDVKGNADIKTAGTMTLQGSNLNVGGSADIKADQVKVLAGQDVERTTTTTQTTSFLKLDGAGGGASAGASAEAGKGVGSRAGNGVGAQASAEAEAHGSAGLTLAETTTNTTSEYNAKSVGSQINVGKNLTMSADKDITLQGANVQSKGDTTLSATNVNVLASQDVHTRSSTTSTTQIGLYVDTSAKAEAQAGAKAGMATTAGASAEVGSDTSIDVARTRTTQTDSLDIHNNGTQLGAGGKLNIVAKDQLNVQGSDLSGDKGVNLAAKDMSFTAANDVSTTSTKTTQTSAGLYISGGASADVSASAGLPGPGGVGAGASASADAKAGVGVQARHSENSSASGTTTAQVSSIRSGSGDVTRTAQGTITDVGTGIDAAGNFTQQATTIDSRAAANTSFSTDSSSSHQARLGVYAEATASAGASGGPSAGGAGVSVGVEASYKNSESSSSSSASNAVVGTIRAGGSVSSTSTGATSMEGTTISAGKDVALGAGSLNYTAARNTETSSSSSRDINAAANVGIGLGDKTVDAGASGGFAKDASGASSSKAVTGSISGGGNVTIKTAGDATFAGTDIAAGGDATVKAGGKMTMEAAHDTSSSTSSSSDFQASISVSGGHGEKGAGVSAEGGFDNATSNADQARGGSIKAGGNVNLGAGSQATLVGTDVQAGGKTTVAAQSVVQKDAVSTSSSTSNGFEAGFSMSGGSEEGEGGKKGKSSGAGMASIDGGSSSSSASSATATSLQGKGGVQIVTGNAGVAAAAAMPSPAPAAAPAAVTPAGTVAPVPQGATLPVTEPAVAPASAPQAAIGKIDGTRLVASADVAVANPVAIGKPSSGVTGGAPKAEGSSAVVKATRKPAAKAVAKPAAKKDADGASTASATPAGKPAPQG